MEHIADLSRRAGDVPPVQEHPAPVGPFQPGEDVEQRGFPRAADAHQAHQLLRPQGDGDVFQDFSASVGLGDALRLKDGVVPARHWGRKSLVKPAFSAMGFSTRPLSFSH